MDMDIDSETGQLAGGITKVIYVSEYCLYQTDVKIKYIEVGDEKKQVFSG